MKKIFFILLIISGNYQGANCQLQQASEKKVEASTVLTPEQMRKDIDYFFETLSKVHANMYAFTSKEEIDRVKEQLYRDCSEPMTAWAFNKRLRRMDKLFDGHTGIFWGFWQVLSEKNDFFPLPVMFREGKIYLLENDNSQGKHILSINGMPSKDIYNRFINANEIREAGEVRANMSFAEYLFIDTDIRSPYDVVVEENDGPNVVRLNGVALKDVKRPRSGLFGQSLAFRMYPEKSIAVIDYNTCNFSYDSVTQTCLNRWFDDVFDQIAVKKIKYLFIDISRNDGGQSPNNRAIYTHIQHHSPIKLTKEVRLRYIMKKNEALNYLKVDTVDYVTPPNPKGFDGSVYLIQGRGSYSAALDLSEWFNALAGAKLIGEQTGQATAIYIDSSYFTMSESGITFRCSYKYMRSLPESHEDRGVQVDYPVKLDYTKRYYELNDLLGFMAQIDPAMKYTPETPPVDGVKVPVKSASANCFQEGENIDKALDGDLNTLYHTPWSGNKPLTVWPVTLTFDFDGQSQIDYFKYYPRMSDMPNGLFGKVEVWASTPSNPTLKKIGVHDFYKSNAPGYYHFPKPLKESLKIKLRVLSAMSWDGANHVSCAEMEFYRK